MRKIKASAPRRAIVWSLLPPEKGLLVRWWIQTVAKVAMRVKMQVMTGK